MQIIKLTFNLFSQNFSNLCMKVAVINLTSGSISGGYLKYLNNILPRMTDNPKLNQFFVHYQLEYNECGRQYSLVQM